jgi:hypothetical protein
MLQNEQDKAQKQQLQALGDPKLDPFEIEFMPEFRQGRGSESPFVNEHGVIIGDHDYESAQSPINQWSKDTPPELMAGDEWVHPFKDIGFHTKENRDYFTQGIPPQAGIFMHPDKDVAYEYKLGQADAPNDDNADRERKPT